MGDVLKQLRLRNNSLLKANRKADRKLNSSVQKFIKAKKVLGETRVILATAKEVLQNVQAELGYAQAYEEAGLS